MLKTIVPSRGKKRESMGILYHPKKELISIGGKKKLKLEMLFLAKNAEKMLSNITIKTKDYKNNLCRVLIFGVETEKTFFDFIQNIDEVGYRSKFVNSFERLTR